MEMATQLAGSDCDGEGSCMTAFLGTCWSLTTDLLAPDCTNEPAWLNQV